MSRYPRMESKKEPEVYVMEVSRGQLILLICVSLFLALTFFGAGVLVGRIDPPPGEAVASGAPSGQAATETYMVPVTAAGSDEGETVLVAVGQSAAPVSESAARRTAESPPRSPFMENRPRLTELPPLPAARPAVPATPPIVIRPDEGEGEADPAAPVQTDASNAPASPAPVPAAPSPVMPTVTPAPAAAAEPLSPLLAPLEPVSPPPAASAPPAAPAASASAAGRFGVQLGAFSGNDRKSRAEAFQRQVRERHGLRAEILPSDDQNHYRVVVTGFADRSAAAAACRDIQLKPELSGAFVRAL